MALYQPTNVIPSSYTKGTVDAVNDKMEISWQVNGNSAMTAFQVDFYLNDALSTYVTTTGKRTDNIPTGGFYGTDRFGRPQFFTWTPNGQSWEEWSKFQLTNGNEYKYKITQFFKTVDDIYIASPAGSLSGKMALYLRINSTDVNTYIIFDFGISSFSSGVVYYNYVQQKGWIITENRFVYIHTSIVNKEPSIDSLGYGSLVDLDNRYDFIIQNSFNIFQTAAKPILTIYSSNEQYNDENTFPDNQGNFGSSIGYFIAKYQQDQDIPIRWIRWQVATSTYSNNKWILGEIIADTGDIYTSTLNYEFNGFFNRQSYAVRAFGESESGQECNSNPNTDGWVYFTINIENQGQYGGSFNVQCLNKENATLLEWEGVEVIPPTTSPQGYVPVISDGSATLLPKNGDTQYSVTWDKQIVYDKESGENLIKPMNFRPDWVAVWKGNCATEKNEIMSSFVGSVSNGGSYPAFINTMAFNPNGNLCVVGGGSFAYLFRVSGTIFEFIEEIKKNGENLYSNTDFIRFSPDGHTLLIGSSNVGIQIFTVGDESVAYVADIKYNNSTVRCYDAVFNSSGNRLIATSLYNGILLYTVSGSAFTYNKTIYSLDKDSQMSQAEAAFNRSNTLLVVYGYASTTAKTSAIYFTVNGDEFTYRGAINDSNGSYLSGTVIGASFSPEDNLLALCGRINGVFNLYEIKNNTILFKKVITKNGKPFSPVNGITDCVFSPNGKILAFSGDTISGKACLFKVESSDVTYYSDFADYCGLLEFSPDSSILLTQSTSLKNVLEYSIQYVELPAQSGKFYTLGGGNNIIGTFMKNVVSVNADNINVQFAIPDKSQKLSLILTPATFTAYFYGVEGFISKQTHLITYIQQPITSISIYGGDSGTTIDSVSVYQGDGSNILSLYENPSFEPVWNDPTYDLYMTANFNGNLEGGTGTTTGSGFRIYRQEVGKSVLTPIATVPSTITSVKDYGIVSRKAYKYSLYAYDNSGAFMSAVENEKVVGTCFKNYSLLVCDYDETNDEYHVRKQYLFALNLSAGSVGNNNSPTLNANFTRYPTRMPSTQNYASGTLQGLIGTIYTVPALIEQIGNYKYTAKPSTLDYFDNVDLEKELYDLSTAPYQLFLRDMKGHLRMVATSGAITMTTNIKQKQQSISISFPWVEIGDASDVTIIQTPDDYGWNNDNQVLDVSLDVDVATGELSATYPFPYNGTKFYLTGVNKETLTAKTPLGVTPAQFEVSDVADQPDDGELNATVKVNSEDN